MNKILKNLILIKTQIFFQNVRVVHFRCSWSTSALIILGLVFLQFFFLVMLNFPFPTFKLFTIVNSFLSWTYI